MPRNEWERVDKGDPKGAGMREDMATGGSVGTVRRHGFLRACIRSTFTRSLRSLTTVPLLQTLSLLSPLPVGDRDVIVVGESREEEW